jgi:hypothetical protein
LAYIRGITAERSNTEQALQNAQLSRKLAEQQTREVQAKQQRIDELLRSVGDSPTKDAVLELQRQIRASSTAPLPARPAARFPAPAREPAVASAAVAPPPAPAPTPGIKVQKDW